MYWSQLYNYIITLAPHTAEGMVGVPEEHIIACENGLDIRLPAAYREFLLTMGVDAGGFYPLGGTMEWNFYEMLRMLHDLPPEEHSSQEFFRISTEPDKNDVSNDYFLDMRTVDERGDCEILLIEWLLPPTREDAFGCKNTFLERVTQVAWQVVDEARFAHNRMVGVSVKAADGPVARKAIVLELLRHAGFRHSLPPLGRIDCLARDGENPATCRVDTEVDWLTIHIASDSELTVSRIVELIADNVEDASE